MNSTPSKRQLVVAAAQLGPIQSLTTPRSEVLDRMVRLLREAATKNVNLVVFPELAFTTFFPSYIIDSEEELSRFFEPTSSTDPYAMITTPNIRPLIEEANKLKIDISFGFGERWTDGDGVVTDYNTAVYYSASKQECIAKYRKIHLPGRYEPDTRPGVTQQLEKRYFKPGNFGFQAFRVPGLLHGALKADQNNSASDPKDSNGRGDPIMGMLICNDRRWAEGWRSYGLQGVELVLEGYNTTAFAPQYDGANEEQEQEALFHHRLSCQAGSYQNACFSIHAAKAGTEDHGSLIAGSSIIDPNGHIIIESTTKEDELICATIDLEKCKKGKDRVFDFEKHRRPEHYSRLVEQVGVQEPPLLSP
ncbi:carbon-nitrogen hydrolase [Stachybotrys elegans]|uniref:Carbon-nitrogen hydrolase n=1 Tax=Stachybotrys elegans TaxID=80388 RepID=A0A8K0SWM5_9HYPO|nr:carbon-nitrogen hydrolase [Stachybotrys elegans]